MKLLPFSSLFFLSASAASFLQAQNFYDWTLTPSQAQWGSEPVPPSGAGGSFTYESDFVLGINNDPVTGESAAQTELNFLGPRLAGTIYAGNARGFVNRTDPNAVFDLSTVGSRATIRAYSVAYGLIRGFDSRIDDVADYAGSTLWQLGLTNGSGIFGRPGNESLYSSFDLDLSRNGNIEAVNDGSTPFGNLTGDTIDVITGDLALRDHLGTDATRGGGYNMTNLVDYGPASTYLDMRWTDGANSGQLIEMTFTNLGEGQLGVGIGIRDHYVFTTGLSGNEVVGYSFFDGSDIADELILQDYTVVDHNFTDLSNLRPGFGHGTEADLTVYSGSQWDWDDRLVTGDAPIPEPSSLALILLGLLPMLRRNRTGR